MASGPDSKWRARHYTAVSGDVFYMFGGCTHETKSLPKGHDHDNDKRKRIASSIEVFDFMACKGLKESVTRGTPPVASMYLSYATIGRDIFCFAGSCKPDSCYHNSLLKLNVNALSWREVIPSTVDGGSAPLKKHGCGMIPFKSSEGRHHILTLGGAGPTPVLIPMSARTQYLPSPHKPALCYTNEVCTTAVSAPPGLGASKWTRPTTTGDIFPPRAFFSANTLQDNRGVVFGGQVIVDDHFERSDDVFIVSCTTDNIGFQKIAKPPEAKWPEKRHHHGSTVITSLSKLNQETQHLVVLGGCNDRVTSDCWIMNINNFSWSKINLPDSVAHRQKHSVTSFSFAPNMAWIVISGGYRKGSDPVLSPECLMIVELVFKQDVSKWSVGRTLNHKDIESDRYHRLLFDCLVQGRRAQEITERRFSISDMPSPGMDKHVAALTCKLQEADIYQQDVLQQVNDLTQQLLSNQEKSDAEKKQLMKERDEEMKGKKFEIKALKQSIKELHVANEKNQEKHKSELDMKIKENMKEMQLKNTEIEDLQQKLQSLQKESASMLENTLKKHEQDVAERNNAIERIKEELLRGKQEISDVKVTFKDLQDENLSLLKTIQQHEEERVNNSRVIQNREEEIEKKSYEIEDLKERMKKDQEKREKFLEESKLLHEKEIKMLKDIEGKEKAVRDLEMKTKELQKLLETTKSKLEATIKVQKKLQRENETLKTTAVNPQWMVHEDEVQMTDKSIGKGSYGEVSVAIFRGTKVAAKCLHDPIQSDYFLGVFTREMDMSSKMHHPNIVQFIGATRGDIPVLLYELMDTSLFKKMQECRLDHPEILRVAVDVLSALAYLHAWKPDPIIHRDISSPNVLMEPCGNGRLRSKLSDFGSANLQRHTKTEWPGNLFYAAPEAQNPDSHTPQMDVYSLGILMMEMVLNTPPGMSRAKREQQADSIQWESMKAVILRSIAEDHTHRPESRELLDEIKALHMQELM